MKKVSLFFLTLLFSYHCVYAGEISTPTRDEEDAYGAEPVKVSRVTEQFDESYIWAMDGILPSMQTGAFLQPLGKKKSPLRDLSTFENIKQKVPEGKLLSFEEALLMTRKEKILRAYQIPGTPVHILPLTLEVRNFAPLENHYLSWYELWADKHALSPEEKKVIERVKNILGTPSSSVITVYHVFRSLWINERNVCVGVPCINKCNKKPTPHNELERSLQSFAIYTEKTHYDSFLIDSFSRPYDIGHVLEPLNGVSDLFKVASLYKTQYPQRNLVFHGVSWGGIVVNMAHQHLYQDLFSFPKTHEPLFSVAINGLPLFQMAKGARSSRPLIQLHGTEDAFFDYDFARRYAESEGLYFQSLPGFGHNATLFLTDEGPKVSRSKDHESLCVVFNHRPTPKETRSFVAYVQDCFFNPQSQKAGSLEDFLSHESLCQRNLTLVNKDPEQKYTWTDLFKSFENIPNRTVPYGACGQSVSGLKRLDGLVIEFLRRIQSDYWKMGEPSTYTFNAEELTRLKNSSFSKW